MKIKLLIIYSLVCLISCQSNTKKSKSLFITTRTVMGSEETGNLKDSRETTLIESDYFEVELYERSSLPKYGASKTIIDPVENLKRDPSHYGDPKNFEFVEYVITDEKGKLLKFNTTTAFLNFMSERGYSLLDQVKNKYSIDYTFKKK